MTMTREEKLQQFAEQNTKGLHLDRHNLIQMVKQGAEWADQHPQWIPVEERLPEVGEKVDDLRIFTPELRGVLNDLAVNVKGNYNTLERQQEDIGYIRIRINHILSLLHPVEEVIKSGGPTALDGLSNVQKDNANKSTNYNGYDPTSIVRGSESTNKED